MFRYQGVNLRLDVGVTTAYRLSAVTTKQVSRNIHNWPPIPHKSKGRLLFADHWGRRCLTACSYTPTDETSPSSRGGGL